MAGKRLRDNKPKVDGVDYALAIFGTGCSVIFLLMIIKGGFSFLWDFGEHGRLRGLPGVLIMFLVFTMSFYSLRKIFNSNKEE